MGELKKSNNLITLEGVEAGKIGWKFMKMRNISLRIKRKIYKFAFNNFFLRSYHFISG